MSIDSGYWTKDMVYANQYFMMDILHEMLREV